MRKIQLLRVRALRSRLAPMKRILRLQYGSMARLTLASRGTRVDRLQSIPREYGWEIEIRGCTRETLNRTSLK